MQLGSGYSSVSLFRQLLSVLACIHRYYLPSSNQICRGKYLERQDPGCKLYIHVRRVVTRLGKYRGILETMTIRVYEAEYEI